jgi:predicted transcriptional regulator
MDHVRIDEGVKRGPRRKDAPKRPNKRILVLEGSKSVAVEQRDLIIAHIAAGRLLRDVARDLGVTPQAISSYLSQDPEYQAAKESGIEQQLERWQWEMERANDPLNLARAREAFRAASWRGEREHPRRWGQKQEVTVSHQVQVDERLTERASDLLRRRLATNAAHNVIDAETVPSDE